MDAWSDIILEWVNCLKFTDPAKSLRELQLEKFVHCYFTKADENYISSEDDVWNFIKTFFSSSCRVEQLHLDVAKCRSGDKDSITLLLSALLIHHFLEFKPSEVLAAMSANLGEHAQVTMKSVLETVLLSKMPVTGAFLKSAILEATRKHDQSFKSISTPLKTSTPKSELSSPLIALLQSPLAQQQRDLSLKNKEIKRLQTELNAEILEKFDFVERMEAAEKEVKSLKSIVNQRDKEIEKLKQDMALLSEESPKKKKCHASCNEALYKDEVKRLESELCEMCKEIGELSCNRHSLEDKVKERESRLKILTEEALECGEIKDLLQGKLELVTEALAARTKECEELREIISSKELPQLNTSSNESFLFNQLCEGQLNRPENLGEAVMDVILQEKSEENKLLSEKLDCLTAEKADMDVRLKALEQDLEQERCQHQTAMDHCNMLKVQVMEQEMIVKQFQDEVQCLQMQLITATDKVISEQHASKVAIETYKENISELGKTVEYLNCELEGSVSSNIDLLQKLSSVSEKITHMMLIIAEENTKNLKDNIKQRKSLAESQRMKILVLLDEQNGYHEQIEELKASYTETLIDKEHLQMLKDTLMKSIDENFKKWSNHCQELIITNEDLASNLDSLRNQHEKVTLELVKKNEASSVTEQCYKTAVDDKELVITTLTDNKLLLERSLADSEKERNALQDYNVKLCEATELAEERLHNMTEKYTALQNRFDLELTKCGNALNIIQQERDFALKELNKLREELAMVERSKSELEDKYNNFALTNGIEKHKNMEMCRLLEKEVENLKLERAECDDKVAALSLHIENMKKESEDASKIYEEAKTKLTGQVYSLQDELVAKQGILESYLAQHEISKKQVCNLNEQVCETVTAAKLNCDRVVSVTLLQMESFLSVLQKKFDYVGLKLSVLADRCSERKVSTFLESRQRASREEIKNERILKQMGEFKEQCDKACRDNQQLKKLLLDLKVKFNIKEQEFANLKKSAAPNQQLIEKAVRMEFELKLEKAKSQMEKLMNEQAEKLKRSQLNERKTFQDQISELQSKYAKEKKASELYRSRCAMLEQSQDVRRRSSSFTGHSTAASQEACFHEKSKSRKDHLGVIQESFTYSRSRRSTVPSKTSPVFPMEDEEGELYSKTLDECDEVFSRTNLENLKAGLCELPGRHRLSELQYRNSLCPPHLKSSYPAETQFSAPSEFKDEDIKMGSAVDIDQSMRLLQSGERHRRKEKGQTSYNKPGPPTPGKNGRQSLQGFGYTTPRSVLREHNDSRRGNTPSRIKEFFTSAFNLRDENTPVTPRSRRMSFFRKQMKN